MSTMTGVSEQGRSGLLWTIFEGEPFCSRRIASFGTEQDARDYMNLTRERDALAAHCLLWRCTFQKYQSWAANGVRSSQWPKQVVADYKELSAMTPAASLDAVIGPTVKLLAQLHDVFLDKGQLSITGIYKTRFAQIKAELTRLQNILQNH